jgi:hypothetical protein
MRRERGILATTEPIRAYGGIQLSLEVLESMAQRLKSGPVPTRLFHDAREPLYVSNVNAGIRQRPDGKHELWVEFDVEEEGWAKYEAERDARGGPGGLSFTLTESFAELGSEAGQGPVSVLVAADAQHFSDDQILAAARELAEAGGVTAGRLYQFAAGSTAVVLVQFLLQEGAQIPPGVFSAWLYDALRHFRPGQASPAVNLEVTEGAAGRKVTASVPAGIDPAIAERAIAAFESVANKAGTYECTPEGSWRVIRER